MVVPRQGKLGDTLWRIQRKLVAICSEKSYFAIHQKK